MVEDITPLVNIAVVVLVVVVVEVVAVVLVVFVVDVVAVVLVVFVVDVVAVVLVVVGICCVVPVSTKRQSFIYLIAIIQHLLQEFAIKINFCIRLLPVSAT